MQSEDMTSSSEDSTTNENPFSEFGDDDLGRLQGILVGDHARRTNERISTLEHALLGAIADLRRSVDMQFAALESRMTGESETRSKAVSNVSDRVAEEARIRERAQRAMKSDFDHGYESTTQAIDNLEQRSAEGLEQARTELSTSLDAQMASVQERSEQAKKDFARALMRAAEEIAGSPDI